MCEQALRQLLLLMRHFRSHANTGLDVLIAPLKCFLSRQALKYLCFGLLQLELPLNKRLPYKHVVVCAIGSHIQV